MLKALSTSILYLIGFFHLISCQFRFPGRCPDVNIIESFDLDRYMGTWYQYAKYYDIYEKENKCQQDFYKNEGNDTFTFVVALVFLGHDKPNGIKGVAEVIAPGKLKLSSKNYVAESPNYLILGTDYDNWAVVYNCVYNNSRTHIEYLWIFTRERLPSEESIAAAKSVIEDNHLLVELLTTSVQTNCPNMDDVILDEPVPERPKRTWKDIFCLCFFC